MGTSGDASNKTIDGSVGGLVWVRRRNGSWWPGRILGQDELPESCLVSPRSGTPVKLLGREDASVDWYNLEKSKRVKAFRCGEYDKCIEKAKTAAANSSKKAVKYARREDAILHALELESARLGKDHPDFFSRVDKEGSEKPEVSSREDKQVSDDHIAEESPTSSDASKETGNGDEDTGSSGDESNSAQELSQSGVSFEEPEQVADATEQSVRVQKRRTPNDSEDDGTEGTKRMRGLEDLGVGATPAMKRKRSRRAHVHEFLKRKSRRRTLTKVLESSAMVSVPIVSDQMATASGSSQVGGSDSKVSGLESNDSKRNNSTVINNNSDSTGISCENGASMNASSNASDAVLVKCKQKENEISSMVEVPEDNLSERLFDVPLVTEEKNSAGMSLTVPSASLKTRVGAQSSQNSVVETMPTGNEELNESGSTSSGTVDIYNINQKVEKGTSEWQLKGKRNSRSRKTDVDDEADQHVDPDGRKNADYNRLSGTLSTESNVHRVKSRAITEIQVDEIRGWSRNAPSKESQTKGTTMEGPAPQRLLPYRQSRFTVNPKYESSEFSLRHHLVGPALHDVPVEVKISHRTQHVPYISLMSKVNGLPITGHPITVEVLDDGFCDNLIAASECHSSNRELDNELAENASALRAADMVYNTTPNVAGRKIPAKHHISRARSTPTKSPKSRRNGLSSKKIRKLSSLTGSHKHGGQKNSVIEKLKGPAIACIPVKLVFSRINAALNSSTRPAHRLITTSNT